MISRQLTLDVTYTAAHKYFKKLLQDIIGYSCNISNPEINQQRCKQLFPVQTTVLRSPVSCRVPSHSNILISSIYVTVLNCNYWSALLLWYLRPWNQNNILIWSDETMKWPKKMFSLIRCYPPRWTVFLMDAACLKDPMPNISSCMQEILC